MKAHTKFKTTNGAGQPASIGGHTVPASFPSYPCGPLSFSKGEVMKATHKGSCQVCGKLHKLPHGLSVHGYTVDFGFFSGVCQGSYGKPFEKSHDLISKSIQQAKNLIEEHKTAIQELSECPKVIWKQEHNRKGQPWVKYGFKVVKVEEENSAIGGDYIQSEIYVSHVGLSKTYLNRKSANEVLVEKNSSRVRFLKREIPKLEEYINWQNKRIENWEEKDLTPIQ